MVTHDVTEAVYLSAADLRAVVAARPGGRGDRRSPSAATAGRAIQRDPRFLDLRDEIEDLLHPIAAAG